MAAKSSDFVRLEKFIDNGIGGYVDVYEFHAVVNGNYYIARHEEYRGIVGHHYPVKDCSRDYGNNEYKRLKTNGYTFAGKYEMDILGYKTKQL